MKGYLAYISGRFKPQTGETAFDGICMYPRLQTLRIRVPVTGVTGFPHCF